VITTITAMMPKVVIKVPFEEEDDVDFEVEDEAPKAYTLWSFEPT